MSLIHIKQLVRVLSLRQLRKLNLWLHELIRRAEEVESSTRSLSLKQTVAEQTLDNKTYRREGVRCGKKGCKCMDGDLHGPYWYAYWSEDGKTRSKYIGKRLPHRRKADRS
jgi:hypothetical protein